MNSLFHLKTQKSHAPQSEEHGKALLQTHIFPLLIGSVLPRVISFLWNCPQGLCIRQSQNRWDIIRGVLFQKTEPKPPGRTSAPPLPPHAIHRYESPSASNARALAARRSPPIDRTDHPSALWRRNEDFHMSEIAMTQGSVVSKSLFKKRFAGQC